MAGTRNYQSIGEVLVSVKTEFPDITISKIRFLEAEGLIEPERTPSGYRKFYADDVERRKSTSDAASEYLPLKVIKGSTHQMRVQKGSRRPTEGRRGRGVARRDRRGRPDSRCPRGMSTATGLERYGSRTLCVGISPPRRMSPLTTDDSSSSRS